MGSSGGIPSLGGRRRIFSVVAANEPGRPDADGFDGMGEFGRHERAADARPRRRHFCADAATGAAAAGAAGGRERSLARVRAAG